jgi:hypothetical protein
MIGRGGGTKLYQQLSFPSHLLHFLREGRKEGFLLYGVSRSTEFAAYNRKYIRGIKTVLN